MSQTEFFAFSNHPQYGKQTTTNRIRINEAAQFNSGLAGPGQHHGAASHDTELISASEDRKTLRERVLKAYQDAGPFGLTDYETGIRIGCRPHSAGTRREELVRRGVNIVKTERRRMTDANRPAIVWRLIIEDERP